MSEDALFYTATMAKIHASQGNFAKAARIYRHLLERDPGDTAFQQALAEAEAGLLSMGAGRLAALLGQWIDLMLAYNKLRSLKKLEPGGRT